MPGIRKTAPQNIAAAVENILLHSCLKVQYDIVLL